MMQALLAKDWRVNRIAFVGGAAATVCPYAVMFAMQVLYPPAGGNTRGTYLQTLEDAAEIAALLTLAMAAVFGGMAFAAERRDRSAEFVAMLPVRRTSIVLSKLAVGVACTAVLGLVNTSALLYAVWQRGQATSVLAEPVAVAVVAALLVLYFALAWALSLNARSPALAATLAAGLATAVWFGAVTWIERGGGGGGGGGGRPASNSAAVLQFVAVCLAIGLAALAGSTAHYLRRVRP